MSKRTDLDTIKRYAQDNNIVFKDREFISIHHHHSWVCGYCGKEQSQSLVKIRRANGKLKCCSRIRESTLSQIKELEARFNVTYHKNDVVNNDYLSKKWECPIHGCFNMVPSTALLQVNLSPCRKCEKDREKEQIQEEFHNLLEKYPHLSLVDLEYKGRRISHKWKCHKHNREYNSSLYRIIKQNGNIRCCGRDAVRGKNHPRFNPNVSNEDRTKREDKIKLSVWAKAVKTRDNWKCVVCGKSKPTKLEAHHLDSYLAHKDSRFEVNNGVTLCRSHHTDFHKKYGYDVTTLANFMEYLTDENLILSPQLIVLLIH